MMPLAFQDQPLLRLALLPYVAIRECLRWRRVHATCYTVSCRLAPRAACGRSYMRCSNITGNSARERKSEYLESFERKEMVEDNRRWSWPEFAGVGIG
jgi:hypothetical protein